MLTVGELFAGIGGIGLGLERTGGFETVWQVEIDDYAQRVLAKHWPNVRRWGNIETFPPDEGWNCDLICCGPPCQPVSQIGNRQGTGDKRWMWGECLRVIAHIQPVIILAENPKMLLHDDRGRTFAGILSALESCGYDAEWGTVDASVCGAPHRRERLFIIAYRKQSRLTADSNNTSRITPTWVHAHRTRRDNASGLSVDDIRRQYGAWCGWESSSSIVCGMDDGISARLDRLRCLGNSVVPQVAEFIGHRILEIHNANQL